MIRRACRAAHREELQRVQKEIKIRDGKDVFGRTIGQAESEMLPRLGEAWKTYVFKTHSNRRGVRSRGL